MPNDFNSSDPWYEFIRKVSPLATTKPYRPKLARTTQPITQEVKAEQLIEKLTHVAPKIHSPKQLKLGEQSDLDRVLRKKMDSGQLKIDGTLDLHGYNRNDAFFLFKSFVNSSYEQNKRLLIVITGKGAKSEQNVSVLKQELPHWINDADIRYKILRFSNAKPKHGGEGAFYVLLKRNRKLAD